MYIKDLGNFLDKDMKRENLAKILGRNSCHIGNRFMGLCGNWFVDLCGNRGNFLDKDIPPNLT